MPAQSNTRVVEDPETWVSRYSRDARFSKMVLACASPELLEYIIVDLFDENRAVLDNLDLALKDCAN